MLFIHNYQKLIPLLTSFGAKMNGQKRISDFFATPRAKRALSNGDIKDETNRKKLKTQQSQDSPFEENRILAKIKLQSKKTPALIPPIGISWFKALESEFNKPYFIKLSEFVEKQRKSRTIYPPPEMVFTWTTLCEIREIKVVILGQDPYHGPGQAHGLCFSVQKGTTFPPSLNNIFKELKSDVETFKIPKDGDLTNWAKQGVLLLNACLTVEAHKPNSHKDNGWELFTDAVITWLNKNLTGLVFLLWGANAQAKGKCIDKKKHHVLTCPHPSPLSVHKGFFGCKHFSKTNEILKKNGFKQIDWSL